MPSPVSPSRRGLLALAGAAPFAAIAASARPVAAAENVCALTPQVTQGPYWFDPKLDRADITEGKKGAPVTVALTVVDGACRPLKGARVDIWHCDAQGIYSGYEGQGDDHQAAAKGATFLRGAQTTDAAGKVAFRTIWPGWYEGRTPHIHIKVHLNERTALTAQLFVPDALSEFLYENLPAYKRPRARDMFNRQDGIALQGGEAMVASVREAKDGYVLALILGVDPAADWKDDAGMGPGGTPPGGMGPPPSGMGPPPQGMPNGGMNGRPPGPPPGGFPNGGPPHHDAPTGEARLKAIVPGL
ncbi:intradiol ring-cleavage dioxygenase [Caulobacter radicis]|uniref:intradiol ring-cleavage dioxygenase n=1 Tax=Caulobacter radicis TaxID=2172650 RepID=UPI000D567492|nr:intradiol ring-cleavage dioxygenase [Caulobacter radicis]PVM86265.1 intradiol ring-cleavage dioxygenase [Caulobacter radicis]